MKIIKSLFPLFIIMAFFSSCEKDPVDPSTIIGQISAPQNLQVLFEIAQDNSGLLSLTPTADGATTFQVFWGDATTDPEELSPGNSASHVYTEGEYTLRVIAVGITGLTSEYNTQVMISFSPPENLMVTLEKDNMLGLTVTPSADEVTLFHVFFGDAENEEPTVIMPGESAMHVYAEPGDYTVSVTALGAGAATAEFSEVVTIDPIPDVLLTFPINFEENAGYSFGDFGNAFGSVIDNPDKSGLNTSDRVGQVFKAANSEVWAGTSLDLSGTFDLSTGNMFKMKTWSSKAGAVVKLKIENQDASITHEVDVSTTVASIWEELIYDFTEAPAADYIRVVVFFDFGNTGDDSNYYFDEIGIAGVTNEVLEIPLDFESAALIYNWVEFGNIAPIDRIDNPDASGINTSNKVIQLTKTANSEVWAGCSLDLENPIDFSNDQTIKMKTWSPKTGAVMKFKIENQDASIVHEVDVNTTVSNSWEELSYDFSGAPEGIYTRIVVFCDFGNNGDDSVYYFDDIQQSDGGSGETVIVENFEVNTPVFTDFGNIDSTEVIDNPDMSGINMSGKVAQLTKSAGSEVWAGSFFEIGSALNLSDYSKIHLKTWSPKSGITVKVKIENADASITHEVDVTNTTANVWENLIYDFSGAPAADYIRLVVFFDFDVNGDDSVYYYDDYALGN